ncbi:MAG: NPCBM/NEW2 domain-containing protein [Clostridia bacterium]|nr:NPCBM/NEW2 domain-containing protein [Clostridia bacterium]
MKLNFKSIMLGCCVGIIMSTGITAFASDVTRSIQATFKNIKIYVDGAQLVPKDSKGNTLEPFIYNGTTYLPVRAVGEAVGKEVRYDANTNSVYLGSGFNTNSGYVSGVKLEPYSKVDVSVEDITMSGNKYEDGICFRTWSGIVSNGTASFNLGGNYNTVSGVYGTVDDKTSQSYGEATIYFYGDGILLKSFEIKAGQIVKNFSINVTGVSQLEVKTEETSPRGAMGAVGLGDVYAN